MGNFVSILYKLMENFCLNISFFFYLQTSFYSFFLVSENMSFSYNTSDGTLIIKRREKITEISRIFLGITLFFRRRTRGHFPVSNLYESFLFLTFFFICFILTFQKTNFSF